MPGIVKNVGKNNGELHDVGNISPVEQANAKCGTENVCSPGARAREPACVRACVRECVCFFGAFRRFGVFGGEGRRGLARRGRRTRTRIRRWCSCWRWAICTYRTGRPICLPSSSPCWYPARSNTFSALVTYVSRCMSACPLLCSPLLFSSFRLFSDLLLFCDVYNSLPRHTLLFQWYFLTDRPSFSVLNTIVFAWQA
jgi:hypothetical protein